MLCHPLLGGLSINGLLCIFLFIIFQSGKIAMHLDLVSHQVRERLDEIKRQEMVRLRNLYREKMKAMNGKQAFNQMIYLGMKTES